MLAELLALRTILLNLHFHLCSGTPVTADTMQRLIERADQDKRQQAEARLTAARSEGPMSYEWGRAAEAGKWQRAVPVWFMSVILLALASGIGVWLVRQTFVWTPLQRFYLSAYTRSAIASSLGHSDRTLSAAAHGEPARKPARH